MTIEFYERIPFLQAKIKGGSAKLGCTLYNNVTVDGAISWLFVLQTRLYGYCCFLRRSLICRVTVSTIWPFVFVAMSCCQLTCQLAVWMKDISTALELELECGPMPYVLAALPNIGGALCSTPQSLADAHY